MGTTDYPEHVLDEDDLLETAAEMLSQMSTVLLTQQATIQKLVEASTALMLAVKDSHVGIVRHLIDAGRELTFETDVDATEKDVRRALHRAGAALLFQSEGRAQ